MKVLVTGGGGFLGRYVVEQLLERGDEVLSVARGPYPELDAMGARHIRGDIRDRDGLRRACKGCDAVIHTAAKAGGLWGAFEEFYGINVEGTRAVIDACRENAVPRLVYTSSPSVVFDNSPQENINEDRPYPTRYESNYPRTKAIAERLALDANGSGGLLTTALRPHVVWGPRESQLFPRLLSRASKGQLVQVGDGTNLVDMTYVEDAARAHLQALDALQEGSPVAGSAYFISQGEPVRLWHWVADLLDRLGLPPVKRKIPLGPARVLGALLEGTYRVLRLSGEPRLTRFLATELAVSHYFDLSRARADFGYAPRCSMEEGMERTMPYLRELVEQLH